MPKLSPQAGFLLRATVLLIGLLTLWWFTLRGPMVYALKSAAGAFLAIDERPSGDWNVRVSIDRTIPSTPQHPEAQQIHSIDFDLAHSDAIAFTFSLPVFWAVILAAPGSFDRRLRLVLIGTAIMAAIEIVLLLVFSQIAARNLLAQASGVDNAVASWGRKLGEYLTVSVAPYLVPFLVALSLDRNLARTIIGLQPPALSPSQKP
jgi:hypothetical protein